jgi:nitrate/nitrite transporter NarK
MTSWPRLLLIYGIGVLAAGQLGIVPPLVPALQAELGLSLATAGTIVSIITLVGGLLGLPAGAFTERTGHARTFCLGLLVMAVAAGLCAVARDAAVLLAARALAGVGYLLVVVAGPSLMAALAEPRHHPIALSLWGTFVPVGIALAGIATASFAEAGWRTIFAVDAMLLAAALLAATPPRCCRRCRALSPRRRSGRRLPSTGRAGRPDRPAASRQAPGKAARSRRTRERGATRRAASPAASASRLRAPPAAIAGAAWLMHRGARPSRLIAIGLAGSTVAAILAFRPEFGLPVSVAGFAISFAIGGLVPSAAFASVPRLAPGPRAIGPINGVLAQAGSLGSLAGPPVLALWVELTTWAWAPALLLGVAVVGAIASARSGSAKP